MTHRIPTRPLCARCGEYIRIDSDADDDLWIEVIGPLQGPGYICGPCFVKAADERLIEWEGRVRFRGYSMRRQMAIQAGQEVKPQEISDLELLAEADLSLLEILAGHGWLTARDMYPDDARKMMPVLQRLKRRNCVESKPQMGGAGNLYRATGYGRKILATHLSRSIVGEGE